MRRHSPRRLIARYSGFLCSPDGRSSQVVASGPVWPNVETEHMIIFDSGPPRLQVREAVHDRIAGAFEIRQRWYERDIAKTEFRCSNTKARSSFRHSSGTGVARR